MLTLDTGVNFTLGVSVSSSVKGDATTALYHRGSCVAKINDVFKALYDPQVTGAIKLQASIKRERQTSTFVQCLNPKSSVRLEISLIGRHL